MQIIESSDSDFIELEADKIESPRASQNPSFGSFDLKA